MKLIGKYIILVIFFTMPSLNLVVPAVRLPEYCEHIDLSQMDRLTFCLTQADDFIWRGLTCCLILKCENSSIGLPVRLLPKYSEWLDLPDSDTLSLTRPRGGSIPSILEKFDRMGLMSIVWCPTCLS